MGASIPVRLIPHFPQSLKNRQQLARQVAKIHADAAARYLQSLNCPTVQKLALLDALIQSDQDP